MLTKYKDLCEKKAVELKRVHKQLFYYKNKAFKRSGCDDELEIDSGDTSDDLNVKIHPLS